MIIKLRNLILGMILMTSCDNKPDTCDDRCDDSEPDVIISVVF